MDDSYYGKGIYSGGRYCLLTHVCECARPFIPLLVVAVLGGLLAWVVL